MKKLVAALLAACLLLSPAALAGKRVRDIEAAPVDTPVKEVDVGLGEEAQALTEEGIEAPEESAPAEAGEVSLNAVTVVPIDKSRFPDGKFRDYIKRYDKNRDGKLSAAELRKIRVIDIYDGGIKSFKGIEYLPALKELHCYYNPIGTLDVSANKALEKLTCPDCKLTSLKIGGLPKLTQINCTGNSLKSLDLSGCKSLKYLSCQYNNLSSLNLSGCASLIQLTVFRSGKLKKLDVSQSPSIVAAVTQATPTDYRIYVSYSYGGASVWADKSLRFITEPPVPPTLIASALAIGVKEKRSLIAADSRVPANKCKFYTSDRLVAAIGKGGTVVGKKAGTATITVTTEAGAHVVCKVTVKEAPDKVTLKNALTVREDSVKKLKAAVPKGTASAITWKSSDTSVATVDEFGAVTGVNEGTAKVTATTYNKKKAECMVTVTNNPARVKYRALLIGQEGATDPDGTQSTRFKICAHDMYTMLNSVNGPEGPAGCAFSTVEKHNLTRGVEYTAKPKNNNGVLGAIREASEGADSNDVFLFYIATHGFEDPNNPNNPDNGALSMMPGEDNLRFHTLASELDHVPGRIVVILDSCLSGQAIYDPAVGENRSNGADAGKAFDQAAVEAFRNVDSGLWMADDGSAFEGSQTVANAGELRKLNKFYVLTASRHDESAWGYDDYLFGSACYTCFTRCLTDGIGTSGKMAADADGDGTVTLDELYSHLKNNIDDYLKKGSVAGLQHIQVYPTGTAFPLFKRK